MTQITLKLYEIERMYQALMQLSDISPSTPDGVYTSYMIGKLLKIVESEYMLYVDTRSKIITKFSAFAEKNEDGTPKRLENGSFILPLVYEEQKNVEIVELAKCETTIDIPKIKLSKIINVFQPSPSIFASLLPILDDDSEEFFAKHEATNDNPDHNTKTE